MKYRVALKKLLDGRWHARCVATPVGVCESTADDRAAALEQIRKEIRYRIEWCPCSGVAEDYVELDVVDEARAPRPL